MADSEKIFTYNTSWKVRLSIMPALGAIAFYFWVKNIWGALAFYVFLDCLSSIEKAIDDMLEKIGKAINHE